MATKNLKFLMGNESSLGSKTKTEGNVYFTLDSTNGIAKIFVDASSSARYNIVPDIVNSGSWNIIDEGVKDPNCCFLAGSKVLCDMDGLSRNIEKIRKNDTVVAYNVQTDSFYLAKVQMLIVNPDTIHLATVTLDNGEELIMNAYHPILTHDGFHSITNHNNYDTLVIGDKVKCIDGYHKIIKIVEKHLDTPITTYNLAVIDYNENIDDDTYDTYVVNGCVVHNADCPT